MKIKWGDVAKELNSQTNSSIFRSGKLCRERWNNYLNPDLKKYEHIKHFIIAIFSRCEWSSDEDGLLMKLVLNLGKKWSELSKQLPGRNENAVKNRFFSLLRKERKRQNLGKSQIENNYNNNNNDQDITNSEEISLISSILNDKTFSKMETENTTQEIKLKNLTSTLENIKLATISRINVPEENKESKKQSFILKKEAFEEPKTPTAQYMSKSNPSLINQNINNNYNIPKSSNNIPQNQNNFNVQQNNNPFLPDSKNNTFFSNIILQNIPKFIQMNTFGYFNNPYNFPNQPSHIPPQMPTQMPAQMPAQMPPQMPPQMPSQMPQQMPLHMPPQMPSQYDNFEKMDNVLLNHPLFQSQSKNQNDNFYNTTPQTLKNDLNLKKDPPSFSAHPLVEKANENKEIYNSVDSFTNMDFLNPPAFTNSIPTTAQFFPTSFPKNNSTNELQDDLNFKFKIKNGLELNPSDYANCLYSVVNLSKKELYLFTPLSNASESNKSLLSAFFNMVPSPYGSQNNDDFISFNSGSRSLSKNDIAPQNNSFKKIKKTNTYNSLVTSQSSNNVIRDINNIYNTCVSNSPPHSPKKDSKFKENYCFTNE